MLIIQKKRVRHQGVKTKETFDSNTVELLKVCTEISLLAQWLPKTLYAAWALPGGLILHHAEVSEGKSSDRKRVGRTGNDTEGRHLLCVSSHLKWFDSNTAEQLLSSDQQNVYYTA